MRIYKVFMEFCLGFMMEFMVIYGDKNLEGPASFISIPSNY